MVCTSVRIILFRVLCFAGVCFYFFFFKQKTAYELRISDWSSDVCSSDLRETLARVAPLPTSVLLTGQSGTGKEVAARSLHLLSDRADKPFVPVNCADRKSVV